MRTVFDQLAKQVLSEMLEPFGPVQTEFEIASEAQTADVSFVPDPDRVALLEQLGVLGRLAAGACLFEPYSRTPGPHEVLTCHGKLLAWYQALCRKAPGPVVLPRLWVVSPGVPDTVLADFELRQNAGWPEGVNCSARASALAWSWSRGCRRVARP